MSILSNKIMEKTRLRDTRDYNVQTVLHRICLSLCAFIGLGYAAFTIPIANASPAGLAAQVTAHNVVLTCTPSVSTVTGYNFYRSSGTTYAIIGANQSSCGYTDLAVMAGSTYSYYVTALASSVESSPSNIVTVVIPGGVTPPPSFTPIRIKPSAAYTDSQGNTWSLDTAYVSGGNVDSTTHAITKALPAATDQKLYQGERWGVMTYTFSVSAGTYTVTLKLAEQAFAGLGKRVFSVTANGTTVISNIDLFSKCGEYVACDQTFNVTVTGTSLVLGFVKGSADQPTIEGIQIVSSGSTPPPPTQNMTTVCSFSNSTTWTCNSTLQNIPSGQAIKSVTSTGTITNTTNGVAP